jgi:hypothetical protein
LSVQAISYVIENSKHKGSYLLTLLMIANHAHSDGTGAWPSIATLARETRLSPRGVQYCIGYLRESGELLVIPDAGPRGCNAYAIAMTQSLRQTKNGMTQDFVPMTQNPTRRDAIAVAPESKNRPMEPSYNGAHVGSRKGKVHYSADDIAFYKEMGIEIA